MAAVLARGETEIVNATREPEITDLAIVECNGGKNEGHGTDTIRFRVSMNYTLLNTGLWQTDRSRHICHCRGNDRWRFDIVWRA